MALDERRVIRDAMDRLLAGQPVRSTGALTVVALAEEAGVKRHLLTHRHPDLKEEFYAKVRAQGAVPHSELVLQNRLAELQAKIESLRADRDSARAEAALLRRMNNVLAAEKAQAESRADDRASAGLATLRSRSPAALGDGAQARDTPGSAPVAEYR